jgi:NAD(P)-dependent dehydrogenase (short-subunit alcohol dehydrogenase family)
VSFPPAARLSGKVAVVTGAARGIGRAVAERFYREGAVVHCIDRLGGELAALADEAEGRVIPHVLDLRDAAAVAAAFAKIPDRVDVLVNNAGIIFYRPVEEISVADWDGLMATNLRAVFLCVREVAARMKAARSGSIINVSSNAGTRGTAEESAYCASKFGIEGFSRSLAKEMAPYNVAVNTVTPGHPVHTAMSETTYDAEKRAQWIDPAVLAPAFVHLALQDASGLNDRHVRAWDLLRQLECDRLVAAPDGGFR